MDKPKISVIVPVHNAGTHLEKCLDSLVNQTLKEIEIILVLDCPTDGSDKVAENYAANDERIKLIRNEENIHTGLSRNKGMDIARGEYIGFFDHDDYCEITMYELLYAEAVSKDCEVVRCNYVCVYSKDSGVGDEFYKYPEAAKDMSNKAGIYEQVCGNTVSCVIWNHIYRADFLKHRHLRFLDSRSICSEDSVFFIEVYSKTQKFGIIPDYLYHHVFHQSNTGKRYDYRSIKNRIAFFERLYRFLRDNAIGEEEALSYLSVNVMKSLYSGSRQALMLFPLKRALKKIRQIPDNYLMVRCINYMYKPENSAALHKLKPTIRIFLSVVKIFTGKNAKT